jgi:hypothetical protein
MDKRFQSTAKKMEVFDLPAWRTLRYAFKWMLTETASRRLLIKTYGDWTRSWVATAESNARVAMFMRVRGKETCRVLRRLEINEP